MRWKTVIGFELAKTGMKCKGYHWEYAEEAGL